jgi:hypothetical protein
LDHGLEDIVHGSNKLPGAGYLDAHPVQIFSAVGVGIVCFGTGGLACVAAASVGTAANFGNDVYHHCSAGQTGVDLLGNGGTTALGGAAYLGEGALEGFDAFKNLFRFQTAAPGLLGGVASAC